MLPIIIYAKTLLNPVIACADPEERKGNHLNSPWYDINEEPVIRHNSMHYNNNLNEVFNHRFIFANSTGDFPAGWQKYRGSRSAEFSWEEAENEGFSVKVRNRTAHQMASICQQRAFAVPVHEKQVWEIGAKIKVNLQLWATIKVHFISDASRILGSSLDFLLNPGSDYYSGIVSVPADVDYAYIELGTQQLGTLRIEDVVFKQVFPVGKYDIDAQGRININTVEVIKRIVDPVEIKGAVEVKGIANVHVLKKSIDFLEDLITEPVCKYAKVQDISQLSLYSFFVINQGQSDALIQVQISPDGINWLDDGPQIRVAPNNSQVLTANYFLRYIRLSCISASHKATNLKIYFQAQS